MTVCIIYSLLPVDVLKNVVKMLKSSFKTFFLFSLLSACSIPGDSGFRDYRESYDAARLASEQVVEVYNQYDKVSRRLRTNDVTFDPDLADVYSDTALSPISAKIVEGFAAATTYTEVLARYLDNNTLALHDDDLERINAATTSVASLLKSDAAGAQINSVIGALSSLLNVSLAKNDRDEFIRSVSDNTKVVDDFLAVIRADTADMYRKARTATAASNGSVEKLKEFRVMLANWVLLIDQTRADLATLKEQVKAGTGQQTALNLLASSAVRIERYAQDISTARTSLLGVF